MKNALQQFAPAALLLVLVICITWSLRGEADHRNQIVHKVPTTWFIGSDAADVYRIEGTPRKVEQDDNGRMIVHYYLFCSPEELKTDPNTKFYDNTITFCDGKVVSYEDLGWNLKTKATD